MDRRTGRTVTWLKLPFLHPTNLDNSYEKFQLGLDFYLVEVCTRWPFHCYSINTRLYGAPGAPQIGTAILQKWRWVRKYEYFSKWSIRSSSRKNNLWWVLLARATERDAIIMFAVLCEALVYRVISCHPNMMSWNHDWFLGPRPSTLEHQLSNTSWCPLWKFTAQRRNDEVRATIPLAPLRI